MKKREMIDLILEELESDDLTGKLRWVAEHILWICEDAGMLPPENPNKYDPVATITPTGQASYGFAREWEPEDEKS
jgi:hypothetical protein